ncbi:adenosylmethionine decarboxylase [Sphingomonas sp. BN140010]|uniref:S-adenosylmethionine decarboxylase proenzyme n=1 Tax=Sphingomonas arvum TaxID=2992113 RepID=A0ABT3JD89_9SPHN|nr:adenosylmethionine decarboxylase [Sphingomonas sp. BN140010]MCW3796879.1 adenosylmethionine decarboxylase [Sphingomonas sp. BN140010]
MSGHVPWNSVHLIADLTGCEGLCDAGLIETVLRKAAAAAGATVLDVKLHGFGEGQGVTGVALLAESHISIHSWPEEDFAAVDIFVCGSRCDPHAALNVIVDGLRAQSSQAQIVRRGVRGHCS